LSSTDFFAASATAFPAISASMLCLRMVMPVSSRSCRGAH
jgi:hypothetical protein